MPNDPPAFSQQFSPDVKIPLLFFEGSMTALNDIVFQDSMWIDAPALRQQISADASYTVPTENAIFDLHRQSLVSRGVSNHEFYRPHDHHLHRSPLVHGHQYELQLEDSQIPTIHNVLRETKPKQKKNHLFSNEMVVMYGFSATTSLLSIGYVDNKGQIIPTIFGSNPTVFNVCAISNVLGFASGVAKMRLKGRHPKIGKFLQEMAILGVTTSFFAIAWVMLPEGVLKWTA
ncbi:hypothetical protein AMTR_s00095p00141320 [Amborella trichopoda]|uniref:Uncharacterized protein n=1 Tax=Amborella trichopoda TaxID=13333 RepID=W1NRN2_AMBTC|nr:hypothetical protein AMTR_s00095p00141320 [Amborella trichopoda]